MRRGTPAWPSRWVTFAHVSKPSRRTMATDFENKAAIVTGTTGIGRAVAKRLARGGAQVLACGIDAEANASLKDEAASEGLALEFQRCDVSCASDVKGAVKRCISLFGGLDILVNSAAI